MRTHRQREIHAVPQSVGKKKLRNRKRNVVRAQSEHVLGKSAAGHQHVFVLVNRTIWHSPASGGVQESRGIKRCGGRRGQSRGRCTYPIIPILAFQAARKRAFVARQDDGGLRRFPQGREEFSDYTRMYDRDTWPAISQIVLVIRGARHRVYRGRDRTDLCSTEKCSYEFR